MTIANMNDWLARNTGQTYGNFIDGEWRASVSGEAAAVYNAADREQLLGYFQQSQAEDVWTAVEAAHRAFAIWSTTSPSERSAVLLRFADLLEANREELAYRLSAEQGKVLAESLGEVGRAAKEARFAAGEGLRMGGEALPADSGIGYHTLERQPIGVVAAIAPWNFPVVTPVRKIAPALAYGCTVVYKPASATPWTSTKLMELLREAGVPDGAVNLVSGAGGAVGNALVGHPLVKGITFTGSTGLGIGIQLKAAERLARTQLELGGKNAAVVLDYSNVQYVAKQISAAAFACSGQRCTAISRVVVLQEHAEELTAALKRQMEQLAIGPAWDKSAAVGPLVNQAHLDSVQKHLHAALEEGAELTYGGEVLTEGVYASGAYMRPALLVGVQPGMKAAQEEIFGPVLSVLSAASEDEALQIANGTVYGLASCVFTERIAAVRRFAAELESGMVHINTGTASEAHIPFGGVKMSGFGAYSIGSSNREFFTESKVVYY
ncbi:aldehyde dehydrogenase family protein [Cohnella cellulosilytica]|uniref:Aldehyde dehydrogenase family protein n=1 Tax=Cohnella cellulosilytica TaxID=986710 RepID=A0ABW2F750_9BACL